MAIHRRITKCIKQHPLWVRNGKDYFCKICGDIDIIELMRQIDRKIRLLNYRRIGNDSIS